ncbi:hypothetical protein CP8484711_1069 [Chlamydia psittaci 84-8471/1]|nr:hypothetical protein CP08DC60_0423 [Chlamydia psittaci 08DC60]EPP30877.1 hypothetical protein CP8484711_1069 [Chlamydia psittaci 84-8471/1]
MNFFKSGLKTSVEKVGPTTRNPTRMPTNPTAPSKGKEVVKIKVKQLFK